tara:strand:- start:119 stop:352 length:234 start_codon:yes stop_codon:yes gene_type:complete
MKEQPVKHIPTPKAPAIDEFLTHVLGIQRKNTIINNRCALCQNPDLKFRDDGSVKEYRISGMCQKCQDNFFGRKKRP